ncbi:MAG: serine/threonine-protein kinase [Planctomycetota bacterium]
MPPKSDYDDATLPPDPHQTAQPMSRSERVGAYELVEEIARGGMGVVFKAKHSKLNRIAALKMILGGRFSSEADIRRFQIEAEAAAKLDHPGIVPVYDIGEHDGQPFFAMKFIDGDSLAGKIAHYQNDSRVAAELMSSVARAVYHAHQRGILHRDLKPANILIDHDGRPLITDLGLAKSTADDSNLTNTGAVLGTPSYMSPEQARGEQSLTTASDIFALGTILYELLTGRPPYKRGSSIETVMSVINDTAEAPRRVNASLDADLELICLKCLEKEPENRYATAAQLAQDLDNWLRGEPISVRAPSVTGLAARWIKKNRRVTYVMLACSFGIAFAFPFFAALFGDLNDLGGVYDQFPQTNRPLIFSIPRLSEFWTQLASMLLLLFIWPGIGLVNVLFAKPDSFLKALRNGLLTALFISFLGFVSTGWLIVAYSASDSARSKVVTIAEAVWPPDQADVVKTDRRVQELFTGLESIPRSQRAAIVADRIAADQVAETPLVLMFIAILALICTSPVLFGTCIAYILLRRELPLWNLITRYFFAWFCILLAFVSLLFQLSNGQVFTLPVQENRVLFLFISLGCAVGGYLTLRRWKTAEPANRMIQV